MRLPVSRTLPLAALVFLNACLGGGGSARPADISSAPKSGPAADYPVVVGSSYVIDGTTFTPVDTMNYDAVGRAVIAPEGGATISGAHHTLPLPSYVEVTALETGKTILVRIERRGPMAGKQLIELSPGSAAQLGVTGAGNTSVRVRRVNPVEADRALLRTGQAAPARMDTPKSLLTVLQRKLDSQEGVARPPAIVEPEAAPEVPASEAKLPKPAVKKPEAKKPKPTPAATPSPAATPKPAPTPKPAVAQGRYSVQVGAYSSKANADAAAKKSGGKAVQSGKFWAVRIGPMANQDDAQAALAKAKSAGYSDARIQRSN